jgi:hypothetical protein
VNPTTSGITTTYKTPVAAYVLVSAPKPENQRIAQRIAFANWLFAHGAVDRAVNARYR